MGFSSKKYLKSNNLFYPEHSKASKVSIHISLMKGASYAKIYFYSHVCRTRGAVCYVRIGAGQ